MSLRVFPGRVGLLPSIFTHCFLPIKPCHSHRTRDRKPRTDFSNSEPKRIFPRGGCFLGQFVSVMSHTNPDSDPDSDPALWFW